MRRDATWARARFAASRVARLATASADGRPHLVPIVYAVLDEQIFTVVDTKPKSTTHLRRLTNMLENPQVSVLVDEYDDDWSTLWWARADGRAYVLDVADAPDALAALRDRYPQYAASPPPGPTIAIEVSRWSGWSAR